MKNALQILAVLGMVVLAALVLDFGQVLFSLFASSSFTIDGVKTADELFRFVLPWKEIGFYAGLILVVLSPFAFFAIRGLNRKVRELETKLHQKESK